MENMGKTSGKRGRGRPKKESQDVDIANQRTRVRKAQIAYRKRKEERQAQTEKRVKDLEDVVEQMTNELVGFSERLLDRNGAGSGVSDGVISDVQGVLAKFLELGRRAAGDGEDDDDEKWEQPDEMMEDPVNSQQAITHTPNTNVNDTIQITESFDPYINTIWSPKPDLTDNSIVPYILSGRDSFASRLYFDTISLAVRSLKGDEPFEYAASILRYKLPYCTRSALFKTIAGILEMLLLGTNKIPVSVTTESFIDEKTGHNIPCNASAVVAETIQLQNLNEADYLSTWEVEAYVKDRWGVGLDSNAVRIQRRPERALCPIMRDRMRPDYESVMFAPTMLGGWGSDSQVVLRADGLIERLKVRCVTLGAGPRWHVAAIEEAVVGFFEENRARIIEVV